MSNISEFADIPEYSITGNITLQEAYNFVLDTYNNYYKENTGTVPQLSEADPITLTLKSMAELYYMMLQYAEKRTQSALLKTATGSALDNMGLTFGVKRTAATYATTTVRFTLSGEQKSVVMIPQGTRVKTAANIYFATTQYAQVEIGSLYVDVLAKAETAGESANAIPSGVVNTLVDVIPYVASTENIDASSGGSDIESDDSLTRRIWLSPTTYSCAGPKDAYEFWARSFRSDVEDVVAVSPADLSCVVYIYFMLSGGQMPSEKDISEMETYLMEDTRRPMTDRVYCKAPEEVEYSIDFTYYIGSGNSKNASGIQAEVAKAVDEFQTWQRTIGRDVSPTELIYRLRAAGVKRVEVRQPTFAVIDGGDKTVQIPKLSGTPTIIYGGIEDD